MTLKRGLNSLIQEYSRARDSTSVPTIVHSTAQAVVTILWVRGWRAATSWKYVDRRALRFLALPT